MLAIAGLWREGEGEGVPRFTMLTTEPGSDVREFHDRQVAILPPNGRDSLLYLEKPDAEIVRPLPAGSLRVSLARAGKEAPPAELLARAGEGGDRHAPAADNLQRTLVELEIVAGRKTQACPEPPRRGHGCAVAR